MNTQKELLDKILDLEMELVKHKAESKTWEQAFRLVAAVKDIPVFEKYNERESFKRKSSAESYQAGEDYATKHILANIKDEEVSEVGVQSAWLMVAANWLREQVVEYVVGVLVKLIKEKAVKAADWLLGQTEDVILKGYDRLEPEDKVLLKNDLKQYPRFAELLKKIEARENK